MVSQKLTVFLFATSSGFLIRLICALLFPQAGLSSPAEGESGAIKLDPV